MHKKQISLSAVSRVSPHCRSGKQFEERRRPVQIHVLRRRRRRGQRRVGERGEPLVRRRRAFDLGRRPPHRVPQQGSAPWMNRDRGTVKCDLRFKSCKNTFSFDSPSIERGRKTEGERGDPPPFIQVVRCFAPFPRQLCSSRLKTGGRETHAARRPPPVPPPLPPRWSVERGSLPPPPLALGGGQVFLHVS